MCFGGGVFFTIYLLHMMPEVQDIIGHVLLDPNDIDYQVAELIVASGFFIVLTVDLLVFDYNKRQIKKALNNVVLNKINKLATQENGVKISNGMHGDEEVPSNTLSGDLHLDNHEDCHSHLVSRSFMLIIALSLHHIFEGRASS